MYIEFKLPQGAGGVAAQHRVYMLRNQISAWAQAHNIVIKTMINGYRFCVEFAQERDYTVFALSWQIKNSWDQYTVNSI